MQFLLQFFKICIVFLYPEKVCDRNHRYFFLLEKKWFKKKILINSTSDFVEEFELLFRYAYLSTVHYTAVFLKPRTYTLYITLYWSIYYIIFILTLESAYYHELRYYFFAFITHHQSVAVNLVHFIIINTALVGFSYYQLQYCLYRIVDFFFFKLRLSKCRKVKTFLRKNFWCGSYKEVHIWSDLV